MRVRCSSRRCGSVASGARFTAGRSSNHTSVNDCSVASGSRSATGQSDKVRSTSELPASAPSEVTVGTENTLSFSSRSRIGVTAARPAASGASLMSNNLRLGSSVRACRSRRCLAFHKPTVPRRETDTSAERSDSALQSCKNTPVSEGQSERKDKSRPPPGGFITNQISAGSVGSTSQPVLASASNTVTSNNMGKLASGVRSTGPLALTCSAVVTGGASRRKVRSSTVPPSSKYRPASWRWCRARRCATCSTSSTLILPLSSGASRSTALAYSAGSK